MTGLFNPSHSIDTLGATGLAGVYYNLNEAGLVEAAVARGEAKLGNGGAVLVETGKHTGRSPKDKHIVRTANVADHIWWEQNAEMSPEGFDALYEDILAHMAGREYFV
ncbi:MAG: phosphoenolpyruvate carboxykinase (ATP), partial [Pseudomonadota bacterium]